VVRFQGEEDCANSLRNPRVWSRAGRFSSEIVAHRAVGGRGGWREVDREANNEQLNGSRSTGTFAVTPGGECRFIRLVNIGSSHIGTD
jgi:hypothetical protein